MCKFVKMHEIVNVNFQKATISGNTNRNRDTDMLQCFDEGHGGEGRKVKGGKGRQTI